MLLSWYSPKDLLKFYFLEQETCDKSRNSSQQTGFPTIRGNELELQRKGCSQALPSSDMKGIYNVMIIF